MRWTKAIGATCTSTVIAISALSLPVEAIASRAPMPGDVACDFCNPADEGTSDSSSENSGGQGQGSTASADVCKTPRPSAPAPVPYPSRSNGGTLSSGAIKTTSTSSGG